MKKSRFLIFAVSAIMVATSSCHRHKEAKRTSEAMTVDVAKPEVDSIVLYKTYPGFINAAKKVDLVARVDGYLTSHPYNGGDFVRKGTLLFTIESRNYSDAVAKAKAALDNAKATYAYASSQYEAMQEALKADAVSQMEVLQAKSSTEEAAAAIKTAEAALNTANTQLGYCRVEAPFDGHVSDTKYDVGTYLSGAAQPVTLATIYDDARVKAQFSIDDNRYMDLIKEFRNNNDKIDYEHMPIEFAEPMPHKYTADLSYMSPSIDSSTGTMILKADVDNPYNELKDGMYVTVSLPYDISSNAILIKDAAIGTDQLGKYIYVVNDSNQVIYTPIEVGDVVRDSMRVVTKGITPEAKYVTKALLKVRDGQKVSPRLIK